MYALAIIRYRKPIEDVLKHVDAHRAYCQGLKQEGLLLASGPRLLLKEVVLQLRKNHRRLARPEVPHERTQGSM